MTETGVIAIVGLIVLMGGFYYLTNYRLNSIEKQLNTHDTLAQRLTAIETKLEFLIDKTK